ncbi:phage host specificity protein [Escherichia coli]|nr:phage host specificity protein [Escherichia coli]
MLTGYPHQAVFCFFRLPDPEQFFCFCIFHPGCAVPLLKLPFRGYPNTALVGVQVDSEQFGSQQVSRNYHLRGRILQVPSNYNPQTRQYSGIWDGTFKPAYSNNMAWCLWDMLTHPRYGMGKRLGAADVDKWALYVIGQYCDQSVPDGFGGTEPRITCNAYLGTGLYWIAASINIKPGHDYYFYIRSVNTVGKSAFVEAVGRASDDAEGYLDFFKGKITESHLGKELLEKVDLTEDNASRLEQFSKEWKDANDKWNAMWGVKIEQTKDGKHYVAGLGLSMEDTEEGKLSQFLVAANRIAFIDPANGNETPMFVAQGNQIFMNDVFLKRLTAPTITSGGSPPAFSLTPDGKLTAKNADISGSVNANSGTLNNVTINENCQIKGKLSANQIEGDIVKTVSKSFPRTNSYASGTITVRISDDQKFDRQVMIPPVLFRGGKHENFNSNNQQSYWYSTCRLRVTRNGQEIFNQSTTDAQGVFSSVIDMPAGQGTLTLTFTVSSSGANNWTPTTSISDLLVVVMKKSTAGISIS